MVSSMSTLYPLFVSHILGLLQDERLATPLTRVFDAAPLPFWSAPASSSGKYHPALALGNGGLVRHTIVCVHIARGLAEPYGLLDQLDAITIAAACHDLYKGGVSNKWTTTVDEHPTLAAQAIFDELAYQIDEGFCIDEYLPMVHGALAAESHMGIWGDKKTPIGRMAELHALIATADYMASRKYFEPSDELAEILLDFPI